MSHAVTTRTLGGVRIKLMRGAAPPGGGAPLLFLHGLGHAAWCYAENWQAAAGERGPALSAEQLAEYRRLEHEHFLTTVGRIIFNDRIERALREAGIEIEADPELDAKFQELAYLEKSIGPTGMRAR